ncbi:hypothetical protein AB205_0063060 [Aquarana catesbeiana]|uniref:Uncharacterized protein n=1 Tax=Aquarana catesbeiana TaxID=8400 RepID=A0A2G9RRG6_AQUCT|nr:hypothetical protein AB205_0063060 [Aquarana catesbeiana]
MLMSFSDYSCSLIVEPVSLLFLFCSSIARKHRQLGGHRGKQVPLLPHEKELLAAVGEDEIRKLLVHQDRLQAQCRRRQRAEEQEFSTSSMCSKYCSSSNTNTMLPFPFVQPSIVDSSVIASRSCSDR